MNGVEQKKILIVEDEVITSLELKSILIRHGYSVVGAVMTGGDAILEASAKRPDLIIMDIGLMGDMNGIEAAGYIKSRYNIPVVFVSANTNKATYDEAMAVEPAAYIAKPFDENQLIETFRKIFQ
jgi:DNA-binding NarL/FixJ family response regulator